jgi:hypothetical protein
VSLQRIGMPAEVIQALLLDIDPSQWGIKPQTRLDPI